MKNVFAFVVLSLGIAAGLQAQSAREYFNELKAADSDTHALAHYSDQYVCFRDDDEPSFVIMARTEDIIRRMKLAGALADAKELEHSQYRNTLYVVNYYKGVPGEGNFYNAEGTAGTDYSIVFKQPLHGKMTYSINWATGGTV